VSIVAVDQVSFSERAIRKLDHFVSRTTEVSAAALVVAEIILLAAAVVARYVFNRPIVWSDEVAGSLFLWLSMLGSVIALRRTEHMRFTALVDGLSEVWQARLRSLAVICIVGFLCIALHPTSEYVEDESFAVMPHLGIASSWRVLGIEIGIVLMLLTAMLQHIRTVPPRLLLGSAIVFAAIGGALWLASPALMAIGNANLLVFFVALVAAAIAIGVPIGFAFGIATFAYLGLVTTVPLNVVINRLDQGMSQPLLLAIPMFVFLGLLIDIAGLARAMIGFLAALLGSVRGGLYYVLLGAMMLVSGISGSKAADMAAIAPGLFPEMRKRGAQDGDLVALLACSAAMADTIPPSIVLITFGSVTGVSIASLFTAGLLPAVVLAVALGLVAFYRSRSEAAPTSKRPSSGVLLRIFLTALPALFLPFVIRFFVVEGITTATEVSTIGIIYALIVGVLIYGPIDWRRLYPALIDTASLSGAILFVIGTATAMAWALTQSGFSSDLAAVMTRISGNATGFMIVTIIVFILLGNILEGIPAILLFAPLLLPVSHAFGIHDVHYAMVVIIAMSIGLFAPPFGVGFYAACAIGKVPPEQSVRHVWRYLAALTAALLLIAAVPWFSIVFL
jgi:tripartite ATP-independent transporter DctM subunit